MRHYSRRVDQNQRAIVAALRTAGCSVQSLAGVGRGCPDLLVGRAGRMWLLEVKRPAGERGGLADRILLETQRAWLSGWRGPVPALVRSPAEALQAIGALAPVRDSGRPEIVDPGGS